MARPDPALLEPSRYPFQADIQSRFQDVNAANHLDNVAFTVMFEDARVRFDRTLGWPEVVEAFGSRSMVASLQVEYLDEAFYPEPVRFHIGVSAVGRSSWTVTSLVRQGDRTVGFMRAIMVHLDPNGPAEIPQRWRDALGAKTLSPATAAVPR